MTEIATFKHEDLNDALRLRPAVEAAFFKNAFGLIVEFSPGRDGYCGQRFAESVEKRTGTPTFRLELSHCAAINGLTEELVEFANKARYCIVRMPSIFADPALLQENQNRDEARLWRHLRRRALRTFLFELAAHIRVPAILLAPISSGNDAGSSIAECVLTPRDDFLLTKPYYDRAVEVLAGPDAEERAAEAVCAGIESVLAPKAQNPKKMPASRPSHATAARVLPNFLIIGAAKSGTSAIAAQLTQHPDLFIPNLKELHFFDRVFNLTDVQRGNTWERYLDYFEGAADFKRRGEATVSYTMIPHIDFVHAEIFKTLGAIPLIYIVRDPIGRIVSQYRHGKRNSPDIEPFNAWIRREEAYSLCIARSDYERQISPYRELFGEQNIHICFYEDYKSDYLKELNRMFEFLDVPPQGGELIKNERVNVTSKKRAPIPEVLPESRDFLRGILRENTHRFLERYGKPADFWPSMA